MSDLRFFDKPAFREYVRLLYELHLGIKEGWDETEAGEAISERMDNMGNPFSREEVASLNGIATDFCLLTDSTPSELSPITEDVMKDYELAIQARETGDFNKALEVLRKHTDRIPPARLAYLRGSIWMKAGESVVATAFFQRASVLEWENANFRYLALHTLWMAHPAAAANLARAILSNLEDYPPPLAVKAIDILAFQSQAVPADQTRHERESLIPIRRDSEFEWKTSGEEEVHKLMLETPPSGDSYHRQVG